MAGVALTIGPLSMEEEGWITWIDQGGEQEEEDVREGGFEHRKIMKGEYGVWWGNGKAKGGYWHGWRNFLLGEGENWDAKCRYTRFIRIV